MRGRREREGRGGEREREREGEPVHTIINLMCILSLS